MRRRGDESAAEPKQLDIDTVRSEGPSRRRSTVTTRAIALAVVFLVLAISYASSLRIYVKQSAQIEATRQQISESQSRIVDLQSELTRWSDPEYVQTQARSRLGWVLPGETGFKVVGEDGQPLGGGAEIQSAAPAAAPEDVWWTKLWGSVEVADQPAPPPSPKPSKEPTITPKTRPAPSMLPSGGPATPR